jgi:hypothetical protein
MADYVPHVADTTTDAFHGTSDTVAAMIVKDGFGLPELSPDNRYGCGVYFWFGSRDLAKWWARKAHAGVPIAIIRATIAFGKYLNLVSWEGQKLVAKVAVHLSKGTLNSAITEAAVLNFMAQKGWIHTALILDMPAQTPVNLFSGSFSVAGPRLILCVYRVENILEQTIILQEAA